MRIETARCLIRPWEPGDRRALAAAANDHEVRRNLADGFPHPYTLTDADDWIAHCSRSDPLLDLAIAVDDEPIGGVGAGLMSGVHRGVASFGYWLGRAHRGQGLVTEAAQGYLAWLIDAFDLRRVEARVYSWNPASARVLDKCGFQLEGRLRSAALRDGILGDDLIYGLVVSGADGI